MHKSALADPEPVPWAPATTLALSLPVGTSAPQRQAGRLLNLQIFTDLTDDHGPCPSLSAKNTQPGLNTHKIDGVFRILIPPG